MDPEYEKRLLRQQNGQLSPYSSPTLSPVVSPNKKIYGDRFIPSRTSACWHINFDMAQESNVQVPTQTRKAKEANTDTIKDGLAYSCLLKNELLSAGIEDLKLSFSCGEVEPVSTVQSRASFCLKMLVGQVIEVKREDTAVVQFMGKTVGQKDFYYWKRKEDVAEEIQAEERKVLFPKETKNLFKNPEVKQIIEKVIEAVFSCQK